MSRKNALDCWVNSCPPNTIPWYKNDGSKITYTGICSQCGIFYEIGATISGGITVTHESYAKIQELNK